jgi:stress response protein SCP2
MSIKLAKGERFNLSKETPDFNKIAIALGWQVSETAQNCDIDASVFMLGATSRIPDEKYFVFYNNLTSPDDAVRHSGDNTTGQIKGDDETIYVDLSKINSAIQEIVFVVTIHEGQEKNQNFSQVSNAFIRLYHSETGAEVFRYNLNEFFSQETALEFGRLYKKNDEWRFQAVGQGYNAGLQSFVDKYYVENAVGENSIAGSQIDDADVVRRFSDRVDKQLREEATAGESVANSVNANNLTEDVDSGVNVSGANLTGANLYGVNLTGVSLIGVNLQSVNLSGQNLIGFNLSGANLYGANLSKANLSSADLRGANLYGANLEKANLKDAKLIGANMQGAKLTGAIMPDGTTHE